MLTTVAVTRTLKVGLLVFSSAVFSQESVPDSSGLVINDNVPAGFEALIEAQTLFVDVHFNDRKVGTAMITADADFLTFDEPQRLVQSLDNVRDPEALVSVLANPLPTNGDRICYSRNQPEGCGQVEPSSVAIIYNADQLEVYLFLAAELQTIQSQQSTRYLPPAETRNTSIVSFDAVASDAGDGSDSLDFSSRALASYGAGNLYAEADYNTRTGQKRLRSTHLTHLFRDHELKIGSYAYQAGAALNNIDILGASIDSSLRTRIDQDVLFGSELSIYLPRRSLVQLLVDDRVYSAERYPAGNQALDTSSLPGGTYEVEIRIIDPLLGTRSEFQLFTNSTEIPPRGEASYGLTLGIPLTYDNDEFFPERSDALVGGLSLARRFNDRSSWRLGLLGINSLTVAEADYIYLGNKLTLKIGVSGGSSGLSGGWVSAGIVNGRSSAGFNARWFSSGDAVKSDPLLLDLLSDSFTQTGISYSFAFRRTSINARASLRNADTAAGDTRSSRQYAVSLRHQLFRYSGLRGSLQSSIQRDNEGRQFRISFLMSFDEPQLNTSILVSRTVDEGGHQEKLFDMSHRIRNEPDRPYQWSAAIRGGSEEPGDSVGLSGKFVHPAFAASVNSEWNAQGDDSLKRNATLRFSSQLGVDGRGFAVGGSDIAQSGVIVAVEGQPRDAEFDILVNGLRTAVGKVGSVRFLGLQPLREYSVQLVPTLALSSSLEQDTFEFTVYPGSVQRISTIARVRVLLIATLVDATGSLVHSAMIEQDPNPVPIGADGFVQAEFSPGEQVIVKRAGLPDCTFTVPEAEEGDDVLVVNEPLRCLESPGQASVSTD